MTGEPLAPTRCSRENIIVPRRSYRSYRGRACVTCDLRYRADITYVYTTVASAQVHDRRGAARCGDRPAGILPARFWARSGARGDCKSRALAGPRGRLEHIPRVTARVTAAPRVPTYLRQPFLPFLSLSSIARPRLVHSRPLRDSLARSFRPLPPPACYTPPYNVPVRDAEKRIVLLKKR